MEVDLGSHIVRVFCTVRCGVGWFFVVSGRSVEYVRMVVECVDLFVRIGM